MLAAACLLLGPAACGGSSNSAPSASAAPTGASSSSSSTPSSVVAWERLAELLPAPAGWTRESDPRGTTDTGENVSRVQLDYTKTGAMDGMSVEIMDVSRNSSMLAPLKESLRVQGTKKTDLGTEKTTTVQGYPAAEEWTPESGHGVVSVLVADRFTVTLTGSSVANVDVIYKFLESIDLKKLAALK